MALVRQAVEGTNLLASEQETGHVNMIMLKKKSETMSDPFAKEVELNNGIYLQAPGDFRHREAINVSSITDLRVPARTFQR